MKHMGMVAGTVQKSLVSISYSNFGMAGLKISTLPLIIMSRCSLRASEKLKLLALQDE